MGQRHFHYGTPSRKLRQKFDAALSDHNNAGCKCCSHYAGQLLRKRICDNYQRFLAKSDGANGIVPDTIVPLQFNRNASVTIPAGERIKSDAVSFPIKRGEKLAVSLYFADFTEMRSGVMITGSMSQGYFAVGDQTQAEHLHPDTSKKTHTSIS